MILLRKRKKKKKLGLGEPQQGRNISFKSLVHHYCFVGFITFKGTERFS